MFIDTYFVFSNIYGSNTFHSSSYEIWHRNHDKVRRGCISFVPLNRGVGFFRSGNEWSMMMSIIIYSSQNISNGHRNDQDQSTFEIAQQPRVRIYNPCPRYPSRLYHRLNRFHFEKFVDLMKFVSIPQYDIVFCFHLSFF